MKIRFNGTFIAVLASVAISTTMRSCNENISKKQVNEIPEPQVIRFAETKSKEGYIIESHIEIVEEEKEEQVTKKIK